MVKKIILWVIAVVITLSAAVYQRLTDPTHPKRVKIEISDKTFDLKLLRSHSGLTDAPISLAINDELISAELHYKFFPEREAEEWTSVAFVKDGENITAHLPNQPMAGKLMYYITFKSGETAVELEKNTPVVIRFKGAVPNSVLYPHIFFMFFSMLLANVAGLFAISKIPQYKLYTYLTFAFLILGG